MPLHFNKQSGLALISVLIFLQIMVILGLYAIESAIEARKMARLDWQQSTIFMTADQALQWVELKNTSDCFIPITSQSDLLAKPINWWQSTGCQEESQGIPFYYVMEKLGLDPCAKLLGANSPRENALEYIRISVLVFDKINEAKELLQSTFLRESYEKNVLCNGMQHIVTLGRQMWREPR
jgi:Tfp pilus assembly protein PilX